MTDKKKTSADDIGIEGVVAPEADDVGKPEQPPLEDDASGLSDEDAEKLGDFA